jgi:tetratricopeptide (TPR) repeat protein
MISSAAADRASSQVRLDLEKGPPTTAGVIAMGNLNVRVEGLSWQATQESLAGDGWDELVKLTALRGHVLGRIEDAERAASFAQAFVHEAPRDARSFLARSRMVAQFHRFSAALADLDAAAALGLDPRMLDEERATIYLALGRYDEALEIHRRTLSTHADFRALSGRARYHAELGGMVEAETWFVAARRSYRGVSPFPLAVLEVQCGQRWLAQDDLIRARIWLESAARRLPTYVPAQGHLAEIDAVEGRAAVAIERLRRLVLSSDDPYYACQLARVSDESAEAIFWRAHAAARYEELVKRHPDAYADHAAEFWLTI